MRGIRAATASELCSAVNAQIMKRMANWNAQRAEVALAAAAIRRRHTLLIDISTTKVYDGLETSALTPHQIPIEGVGAALSRPPWDSAG